MRLKRSQRTRASDWRSVPAVSRAPWPLNQPDCQVSDQPNHLSGPSLAHTGCASQQYAPHHRQVAQREQGLHLRHVLLQPAVAHFGEAELALDHTEGVFTTLARMPARICCELSIMAASGLLRSSALRRPGRTAMCQATPSLASGRLLAPL